MTKIQEQSAETREYKYPLNKLDSETLKDLAEERLTATEISAEMELPLYVVRRLARHHNVKLVPGWERRAIKSIEARVGEMKPLDAVAFLLDVAKAFIGTEDVVTENRERLGLTGQQALLYTTLATRPGVALSYGALSQACSPPHKEAISDAMVKVLACHVKKKLPAGERLRNVWGHGYVLERDAA